MKISERKELLLLFISAFIISCSTPVVNQLDLYGVVDDVSYYNNHNHVKTWCWKKEKYYEIITDQVYQVGDTIRIR